jgi:transposase
MIPEEIKALVVENEQLRAELAELLQRNEQLRTELQAALIRIAELEKGKTKPPSFVKTNRPPRSDPPEPRKKRAAEQNKSRKREEPTRIERHALAHCPDCGYRLRGESVDYTRQVIELPPPEPVEVIEHQVVKRWCPHCAGWRSPRLDLSGQVIGQGRIGVRIAGLVAYLRTTLRLPVRQIQTYLETVHNLHLSNGEIVELTHQVRRQLQSQADALKAAVQVSPVVHGDETGWRENGRNGYLWAFVTEGLEAVRYFQHDKSRGHQIAARILGSDFDGYLVTDFYAAYNLIPSQHQRCWVHLLRDLHELKESHAETAEVLMWAAAVRQLYEDAQDWLTERPEATCEERQAEYHELFEQAGVLGKQYALTYQHPCCALAKRVMRHQDELFQFVLVPGLPADNNLAERSLRPLVVIRKVSGGSRSPDGTKTRLTLASLFGTWAARNVNPFLQCLAALQHPPTTAPP